MTARRREKVVVGEGGISSSNSGIQSNNYSARSLHCEAKSCAAGFNSSSTGAIVSVGGGGGAGGGGLGGERVRELKRETFGGRRR